MTLTQAKELRDLLTQLLFILNGGGAPEKTRIIITEYSDEFEINLRVAKRTQ